MDFSPIQARAVEDALGHYKLAFTDSTKLKVFLTGVGGVGGALSGGLLGAGVGALYKGLNAAPGEGWHDAWQGAKGGGAIGAGLVGLAGGLRGYSVASNAIKDEAARRAARPDIGQVLQNAFDKARQEALANKA